MGTNIKLKNGFPYVITKWFIFFFLINGITCIELLSLNVPARVRKGSEVQLSCLYDLGNASLYSLKWFYRNHNQKNSEEQEFFRYTPRGKPIKRDFHLDRINVDKSDGGTVYLKDLDERSSGLYKCEISVEGTFQTVFAEKLMIVDNANTQADEGSSQSSANLVVLTTQFLVHLLSSVQQYL